MQLSVWALDSLVQFRNGLKPDGIRNKHTCMPQTHGIIMPSTTTSCCACISRPEQRFIQLSHSVIGPVRNWQTVVCTSASVYLDVSNSVISSKDRESTYRLGTNFGHFQALFKVLRFSQTFPAKYTCIQLLHILSIIKHQTFSHLVLFSLFYGRFP